MPRIEIEGGPAFDCAPDDTVLRAALRAGLGAPYACNVGACGNCRFELKAGEVEHLREDAPAWTERDRKRGRWLGCQAKPLTDCVIKLQQDPETVPAHPPARRRARLASVEALTHDISEFRFEIEGDDGFRPGQYALIEPDGVEGGRAYSMCNLPGEGVWAFQIKRVPGGAATGALFDALRPGDAVTLDGPYGTAFLREDAPRDLLLVAGGSGLSPMVSIARAAVASPALEGRAIRFFYGGRAPRDLCAESLLEGLPGWGDRVTCVSAISEAAGGWDGPRGFIHDVVREAMGDALPDHEVYFAGPAVMATAMQTMLNEAGVPASQLHFDEFY